MKLGLLSDTHGHVARTRAALDLLLSRQVDHLIHCGDVGSDLVFDQLLEVREQGLPVTVIPGNVDEWDPGIMLYARTLDFPFRRTERLSIDHHHIAVHHGHDPDLMRELLADPDLTLLFTGHTHVAQDERFGQVRVINPGAVFRASVPSCAVFDTTTDHLDLLPLQIDAL